MTIETVTKLAHTLFDTKAAHVDHVQPYTLPAWRDGGWKGWRIAMAGGTIHWLSRRGRHEEEVCCKRQTTEQEVRVVEVVRR